MKVKKIGIKVLACAAAIALCYGGFFALLNSNQGTVLIAAAEDDIAITTGTLNYSDKTIYEGEILQGTIRNGTGTYSWSTGEKYSGVWENDRPSGYGRLEWPGLGIYEGEFVNGKREGTGVFTWTYDGEIPVGAPISYIGEWVDDKIENEGTLVLSELGTYEGTFSKQQRSGSGTFTWQNGDVYVGSWARDAIDGKGVLTMNDGTILEGTFNKGVLQQGKMTYGIAGGTVVRDVQYGKPQQGVVITYNDGTVVTGRVRDNQFYGDVTIQYSSGDTYVGALKNGVKEGRGTYTWKSGAHYAGEWANDKMSGKGKYCYSKDENVLTLTGMFSNGVPEGKLTYVSDTKLRYETTWSGGKCIDIVYKR